jgi:hypothetical protein
MIPAGCGKMPAHLGGRSSIGRASGCGPEGRGFDPRRSPQAGALAGKRLANQGGSRLGFVVHAPLAQRQSNGLLIRRFWVRIPGGAPLKWLVKGHIFAD